MNRLLVILALCACSPFPELGGPDDPSGLYPRIEPIDGLILRAMGTNSSATPQPLDSFTDPLEERIARLKARAAILRGAPVNDQTRQAITGQ